MPDNVDSDNVSLNAGESQSGTLSWTPASGDIGDWFAIVESEDDSDNTQITVAHGDATAQSATATADVSGTSIGGPPTWETAADWDDRQSEAGVHHEQPANTDWAAADVVEKGWPSALPDFGPSLLAYYPLAETDGTTATDVNGTGTDGTYSGVTLNSEDGPLGFNAPSFDGSDDYIDTNSEYTSPDDSLSMACWIKKSSWATNYENILSNYDGGDGGLRIQRDNDNNALRAALDGGSIAGSTDIADGEWHHIAARVASEGNFRLWIDGSQDADQDISDVQDSAVSSANHWIGSQPGSDGSGSNFWNGEIAHVMIFDGALSAAEVQALYEAAL